MISARDTTTRGLLWATVSFVSFGMSGTLAKGLMLAGWSPGATVTVRVLGAALVMAAPAALMLRGRWAILRRHAGLVVAYGVLAVAGTQLCYFLAIQSLSVSIAILIEFMAPIMVVGWLWARHGQRPGPVTLLGAGAAMAGLVLVLDPFSAGTQTQVDPTGVGWALIAAGCVSCYFILSARPTPELPEFVLVASGMAVGALTLVIAGAAGLTTWTWSTQPVVFGAATVDPWLPLAALVLVTAVLAYSCGLMAVRALGARVASFVAQMEVLTATGFAWLLLGELPRAVQLLGGLAIVAGAVAVKAGEVRDARRDVCAQPVAVG